MTPRLAANLSHELLDLLAEGLVVVDAVKVPTSGSGPAARDADIALARSSGLPVILHHWGQPLTAGSADLMDRLDLEDLRGAVHASRAAELQVHLYLLPSDAPDLTSPDRQSQAERRAILDRVRRNIEGLQAWSGLPVLVENGVHWGTRVRPGRPGSVRCVVEPDFIRELVETTGCGLLLDVAHAQISALYLGLSFEEYLVGLPLAAVRELHANRPLWVDGVLRDRHGAVEEEDADRLARVLSVTTPGTVTLEYGTVDPVHRPTGSGRDELLRGLKMLAGLLGRG